MSKIGVSIKRVSASIREAQRKRKAITIVRVFEGTPQENFEVICNGAKVGQSPTIQGAFKIVHKVCSRGEG